MAGDNQEPTMAQLLMRMEAMMRRQEQSDARAQLEREEAERRRVEERAQEEKLRAEERAQVERKFDALYNQLLHVRQEVPRSNASVPRSDASVHGSSTNDNPPPPPPPRTNYEEDRSLKLELPEFDGSYNPEAFLDWLRSMERIFEYKGYDEQKKCKVAALKLTKHASLWYENLKEKRRSMGKGMMDTWAKLKKYLKTRFLPTNYTQERFLKLADLT